MNVKYIADFLCNNTTKMCVVAYMRLIIAMTTTVYSLSFLQKVIQFLNLYIAG